MRLLRWLLLLLLLVAAAIGGALAFAGTEAGGRMIAGLATRFVPGLTLDGLRLQLPWRIEAGRIAYADAKGDWVEIEGAEVSLDPAALARREVRVTKLAAKRVALPRLPQGDATTPSEPSETVLPALPKLPVAIAVEDLAIERLELGAPVLGQAAAFSLHGKARLADGTVTAELAADRLDHAGSLRLAAALNPAEDRLSAKLALREGPGGIGATLAGRPDEPLSLDLTLDGPASGAALDLRATLGSELAATARGTVRATPAGDYGATLEGEARLAPLLPPEAAGAGSPLRFALDADLDAAKHLALRDLTVTAPAGRVTASGSADLARESVDLAVKAELGASQALGALLPPGVAWRAVAAEAKITGTLGAPVFEAKVTPEGLATGQKQADALLGPAPVLTAKGRMPGPEVDAVLAGAQGRLTVTGNLGETLDARATLAVPKLEALGAGSTGALNAEVIARGPRGDPTLDVTAESGRLVVAERVIEALSLKAHVETPASAPQGTVEGSARVEGLPLTVALDARAEESARRVRIARGDVVFGPARLNATGLLDIATTLFTGEARLVADDLAPFRKLAGQPDLAGRLNVNAKLAPRDGQQGFDVTLDAPTLDAAGQQGRIQASVSGTPKSLDFAATAGGPQGNLTTRGRLAEQREGWQLDLAALEGSAKGQTVRLAAPTRVTFGAETATLAPTELALGTGRIRAQGRFSKDRIEGNATLTALPLSLAEPFLPDVKPEGTLSGEIRVSGTRAAPQLRATLTGTGLGAGAPAYRGLPRLALRAEGTLAGPSAQLRAEIDAGASGRVTIAGRLPNGFGPQARLSATANGDIDLGPLTAPFLAAGADRVTGRVQLALRADGTLAAPQLGGQATLQGLEYRNPVTGGRVSDLRGSIRGEGRRLRFDQVTARTAGGGTIAINGTVEPTAPGIPADLTLTARNARPWVSDLGTATISADLRLRGPAMGAGTLAGDIRIERAELRVPETLPAKVPVLEPIRYLGRTPPGVILPQPPAPATAGAPPLNLQLRILAPREIFVRGRGVDVELGGEIDVGGTIAAPRPSGEFKLRRGTLDILARQLQFTRGTISFRAGTLEPQLDLAAQAVTRGYTIIVAVQGSPANPEIRLTSNPELPQDEVLARLLFDRATSNLSPFEIAQIAQAIGQLTGVGGGFDPLGQVRNALGLDRLGVSSATEGQTGGTTIEAGKYVAPGVFVGVRQGTAGGQTGVGVQVELTPQIKLEGQTATGPAGDRLGVTYEFEY